MFYLNDIEYFIPDQKYTIFELSERYDLSEMQLSIFNRFYGLNEIPVSDEPFAEVLLATCQELIERNQLDRSDIKVLVFSHTITSFQPFSYTQLTDLKTKLDIPNALVFGMTTNNCASSSFALDIINRLLARDGTDKAIFITSDIAYCKDSQIIADSTVLGDALTVSLLSREATGFELISNKRKVFGQHSMCSWEEGETLKEFQKEYTNRLSDILCETIDDADMDFSDIKIVIPHNVNIISWKKVALLANFDRKKLFLENIDKTAHCFGSDVFINMKSVRDKQLLEPDDHVLVGNAGLGAVFNGMLWRYVGSDHL
ncbi:MAG: hypothetical protein JKY34_16460 [Kordiimonadaceae bacterium]|nr:hypothetical protein [Kordiimonadaceae bacterium]